MLTPNYAKYLPDSFKQDNESNNYKLLQLAENPIKRMQDDINDVYAAMDIDGAYGATLDLFGEMVNQKRGAATDEQYRFLIKGRIGRNTAGGDYGSIIDAIISMFSTPTNIVQPNEIELVEQEESCTVKLEKMPINVLAQAGFTSKQAVQMIENLLPICVTLEADMFEGTFEFSAIENEYDENKGFADDAGTIGGTFSMLLGEDKDTPLPI